MLLTRSRLTRRRYSASKISTTAKRRICSSSPNSPKAIPDRCRTVRGLSLQQIPYKCPDQSFEYVTDSDLLEAEIKELREQNEMLEHEISLIWNDAVEYATLVDTRMTRIESSLESLGAMIDEKKDPRKRSRVFSTSLSTSAFVSQQTPLPPRHYLTSTSQAVEHRALIAREVYIGPNSCPLLDRSIHRK